MGQKVKISLTDDEAYELLVLVQNSNETGNEEWDVYGNQVNNSISLETVSSSCI